MADSDSLAIEFEAYRPHLRGVAYRVLGSAGDADDAVQETWLRLHRTGEEGIENLGGWLTTVVARVCLDMIRARSRREEGRQSDGDQDADDQNHHHQLDEREPAVLVAHLPCDLFDHLDSPPSYRVAI